MYQGSWWHELMAKAQQSLFNFLSRGFCSDSFAFILAGNLQLWVEKWRGSARELAINSTIFLLSGGCISCSSALHKKDAFVPSFNVDLESDPSVAFYLAQHLRLGGWELDWEKPGPLPSIPKPSPDSNNVIETRGLKPSPSGKETTEKHTLIVDYCSSLVLRGKALHVFLLT